MGRVQTRTSDLQGTWPLPSAQAPPDYRPPAWFLESEDPRTPEGHPSTQNPFLELLLHPRFVRCSPLYQEGGRNRKCLLPFIQLRRYDCGRAPRSWTPVSKHPAQAQVPRVPFTRGPLESAVPGRGVGSPHFPPASLVTRFSSQGGEHPVTCPAFFPGSWETGRNSLF